MLLRSPGADMRRREFLGVFSSVIGGWPLRARAQQSERKKRIAVLTGYVEDDPEAKRRIGAFQKAIEALGWTEKSAQVNYRFGAGDTERLRREAVETVETKPDVILASGTAILMAVGRATRTIPVVFVQIDDPLASGIVKSLAHPGGNFTGFSPIEFSMGGKMLGVLKDVAPRVAQVAVLINPDSGAHAGI